MYVEQATRKQNRSVYKVFYVIVIILSGPLQLYLIASQLRVKTLFDIAYISPSTEHFDQKVNLKSGIRRM